MRTDPNPPSTDTPARPRTGGDAQPVAIVRVSADGPRPGDDWVATEEPLEIRAHGPGQEPASVAVTMRTPGHDVELAVGFLLTEGLIRSNADLDPADRPRRAGCNVVRVPLAQPFDASRLQRHFFATSSCGLCGKASLDQIAVRCDAIVVEAGPMVEASTLIRLPDALRAAQRCFDRTGGLHAAGLFAADGTLVAVREDVGRHNAVDKLVGRALLDDAVPLAGQVLLVSGRTSFEILQKAAVAGVPVVCAVSAPSSLAVAVADRLGITLVGFLRGRSFNVYTHSSRIHVDV